MSWLTSSCNLLKNALKFTTNYQQTRNTFILRRKHKVPLYKIGGRNRKLTNKYFHYELVEDTNIKLLPDIKIILTKDVTGCGEKGDLLEVRPQKAYKYLLLPGHAVYATPKNIIKYNAVEVSKENISLSSLATLLTAKNLASKWFNVTMSRTEPWVLEPCHLRVTFQKTLFKVPEDAIELPPYEIRGPDLSLQNKLFYVTVKMNENSKVKVVCYINHWPLLDDSTRPIKEALFPEQAEMISKLIERKPKDINKDPFAL